MVFTLSVDSRELAGLHGNMGKFINIFPRAVSKDLDALAKELTHSMVRQINMHDLIWKERLIEGASTSIPKEEDGRHMRIWKLPQYAEWLNKIERGTYSIPTFSDKGRLSILKKWAEQHDNVPRWITREATHWLDMATEDAKKRMDEKISGKMNIDNELKKIGKK